MAHIESTVFCDGCGTEITWTPFMRHEKEYCCEDCAHGIPCSCGDLMELGDEVRAGYHYPATEKQ